MNKPVENLVGKIKELTDRTGYNLTDCKEFLQKTNLVGKIKELRDRTGYNLTDCKEFLQKTNGNIEEAQKLLRAKYVKKAYDSSGNFDSDFEFQDSLASFARVGDEISSLMTRGKSEVLTRSKELFNLFKKTSGFKFNSGISNIVDDLKQHNEFIPELENIMVHFREPFILKEFNRYKLHANEVAGYYVHNKYNDESSEDQHILNGQKGALVVIKSENSLDSDQKKLLERLARTISMTMIANEMNVLEESEVDPEFIEDFRQTAIQNLKESKKPENMIEKILSGQLKKMFEEKAACHAKIVGAQNLEWLKLDSSGEISVQEALNQTSDFLKTKLSIPFYKIFRVQK